MHTRAAGGVFADITIYEIDSAAAAGSLLINSDRIALSVSLIGLELAQSQPIGTILVTWPANRNHSGDAACQ